MRDVRRVARLVAPFGACRSSIEPVVVSHSSGSAGSRNCYYSREETFRLPGTRIDCGLKNVPVPYNIKLYTALHVALADYGVRVRPCTL